MVLEKNVRSTGEMSTWSICQALNNGGTYCTEDYCLTVTENEYEATYDCGATKYHGTYFVKKWKVMGWNVQGFGDTYKTHDTFEDAEADFWAMKHRGKDAPVQISHIQEVWV